MDIFWLFLGGITVSLTSSWETMKEVFSNRNILAIGLTTSLWTLCNSGWRPFWSIYLTEELGADLFAVGLLSTIQTADQLLFQLPGGLLADRVGRKPLIMISRITTPISLGLIPFPLIILHFSGHAY